MYYNYRGEKIVRQNTNLNSFLDVGLAGDLYFLNKLHRHVYYSDATDPYEKIFITIKGRYQQKYSL